MADASIIISVQADGAARVKRELDGVTSAGRQSSDAMALLQRAFLALGGLALAREIIQTADAFTNIQNRIRLVTDSTEELNTVTQELFRIANETRVSFQSTAEIYSRTAQATKELGLTQQETLDFTESLNQAVILSGASATESSAALIQLSQGLASGTLRGDELRSVLEQLPKVADVIADHLGVTRGQLRDMGAEGKITAEMIIQAFREASGQLQADFGTTVPTVGQALTVLQNNFVQLLGAFNQTTGASETLARFILELSNNMVAIGHVIGELAITLGVTFGVIAINRAILGLRSLYTVMLANPFFALVAGVVAVVQAFGGWEVAILSVEATLTASAAGWMMTFNRVGTRVQAFGAGIAAVFTRIKEIFIAFTNFMSNPNSLNLTVLEDNIKLGLTNAYRNAFDAVQKEGDAQLEDINNALEEKLLEFGNRIDAAKNREFTITGNADLNVRGNKTATSSSLDDVKKKLEEQKRLQNEVMQLIRGTYTEEERLAEAIAKVNEAKEKGAISDELAAEALRRLAKEYDVLGHKIADDFDSALDEMIEGSKSATDIMLDFFVDMSRDIMRDALQPLKDAFRESITGGSAGGGTLGGLLGGILGGGGGGLLSGLFGSQGTLSRIFQTGSSSFIGPLPGFAEGGSMTIGGNSGVDKNLLSLNNQPIARVGRGEVLNIDPNNGGGDKGGGVNIYQNINVSTGVQSTVRAELQRFLPVIEKQTTKAYEEAKMRGAVT